MRMKPMTRLTRVTEDYLDKDRGQVIKVRKLAVVDEGKFTSVSVEGQKFKFNDDGTVDIPDRLAPRLLKEGWKAVAGPAAEAASGAASHGGSESTEGGAQQGASASGNVRNQSLGSGGGQPRGGSGNQR